jgi:hypothetical protein
VILVPFTALLFFQFFELRLWLVDEARSRWVRIGIRVIR